jgi:hypothetical protein
VKAALHALLGLLLLAAPAAVQAQFDYTNNENGTCTITAYTGPCCGAVTIPTNINGLTVIGIGVQAFPSDTGLTSVTIPDSVTYIGDEAFYGCWSPELLTYSQQEWSDLPR